MWWCRGCLTIFFKGFLAPKLNLSLQFSSCGPWRVFGHSNSPPHRALGQYRHMSSSRQIHIIFCWLEILNYWNGNFHCSSSFLKATSLICEAQLFFAAHQKYICFFSLWWMIKGIWTLFSLLFIFLWNRKPCVMWGAMECTQWRRNIINQTFNNNPRNLRSKLHKHIDISNNRPTRTQRTGTNIGQITRGRQVSTTN